MANRETIINVCRLLKQSQPTPAPPASAKTSCGSPPKITHKSITIDKTHFEALENWLLLFTDIVEDQPEPRVFIDRQASALELFNIICQCQIEFWESLYLPGTDIITVTTLVEHCPFSASNCPKHQIVHRLIHVGQAFGWWKIVNPLDYLTDHQQTALIGPIIQSYKGIWLPPGFLLQCRQFIDRHAKELRQ